MNYNSYSNYGNYQQQGMGMNGMPNVTPVNNYQQNIQPQPYVNPQVNANQPINGFVWVQGEMEAMMYPVAAGNSVILMDSENPVMYMKTREGTGKYLPLETYDLVKREPAGSSQGNSIPGSAVDMSEYVKLKDLDQIISEKVKAAVEKALE